jgi:hypothetical protein
MIVVDTNVLVGALQTFDLELRGTARGAVKVLYRQGEQLVCFPQNLVEFWNASTRPANANGLGFTPEQAARYVAAFLRSYGYFPKRQTYFQLGKYSC